MTITLSVIALTLTAGANAWNGFFSRRNALNIAHLLESDLRLAQQTAIASAGDIDRVELCLRSDGYDVDTVVYQDPIARSTPVLGRRIRVVNRGKDYPIGVTISADAGGTVTCTAAADRAAVAFNSSGAPEFADTSPHTITVMLGGRSYYVTIQPLTGLASVSN